MVLLRRANYLKRLMIWERNSSFLSLALAVPMPSPGLSLCSAASSWSTESLLAAFGKPVIVKLYIV